MAIAADHAGFELKTTLASEIERLGHQVVDLGAHTYDAGDDYPDFAAASARAVAQGEADRSVLICGSGVGASIAANKVDGARAGLCHDTYSAHQGVEHDDMNVLVLGSRIIGVELARELIAAFLKAKFSGDARHVRRLEKVKALERR
ncbi:MAG TPA: ribose 5-phosphate isomerase B [Bryobacteraceae bacterium]|nr:ribose 5-phosphate isomerase B [Bryobacteraceae bacterium]